MNIKQVSMFMNKLGVLTTCENNVLQEIKQPYENYYKLEEDNNTWLYGLFMVENQNNPYLKEIKKFDSETDGAKHFLLSRLSSYYFSKRVRQFMMENDELDIGGPPFDENKLYKAMASSGIPASTILLGQFDKTVINNRVIKLTEKDENDFVVSFINSNGKVVHSTLPIHYQRAYFMVFKKAYLLHLFEQEVSDLLEKENLRKDISDRDISIFLA
ncbi:hypothetical protein [Pseudalkalibacillus hwajinpoensis]|uniref:hypothetical protein n=1 Tax=Guptibacillus hwajinpoensis TaxID=208199 RepID=UPI00384ECABB